MFDRAYTIGTNLNIGLTTISIENDIKTIQKQIFYAILFK